MQRTTLAIVAAAAVAAAAALAVWAAGFAIFGFIAPVIGAPTAAAVVAASAAGAAAVASLLAPRNAPASLTHSEAVQSVAPSVASPAPLGIIAAAFRERPVVSLGLTVFAGMLASRQPQLVREIASALADRR